MQQFLPWRAFVAVSVSRVLAVGKYWTLNCEPAEPKARPGIATTTLCKEPGPARVR